MSVYELSLEEQEAIWAWAKADDIDLHIQNLLDTGKDEELIQAFISVVKEAEMMEKAIAGEVEVLNEKKRYYKTTAEDYKGFIQRLLVAKGSKKVTTERGYTAQRRSSKRVVVTDWEALPIEFLRFKDPEPDKTALRKALAEQEIAGAYLEESESLSVR